MPHFYVAGSVKHMAKYDFGYGEVQNMTIMTKSGMIISKMSGKMYGFYSINTNPLDNPFCNKSSNIPNSVCSKCYSRRMLMTMRKSCNPSWSKNGRILSREILPNSHIPDLSGLTRNGAFRFSSHGEIMNGIHLTNLLNIAARNPDVTFGLWTKRIGMICDYLDDIPPNVILVASTTLIDMIDPVLPAHFDKVFNVYTKPFAERHGIDINCTGKCADCMLCYDRHNGVTHINELVK